MTNFVALSRKNIAKIIKIPIAGFPGITLISLYLTNKLLKLQDRIVGLKYFNHWIIFCSDLFFSTIATLLAIFFIEIAFNIPFEDGKLVILLLSVGCSSLAFLLIQTYKGVIRHASFSDAGRISFAAVIKDVLLIGVLYILAKESGLKDLLFLGLVDLLFTFFILIFVRVMMISVYRYAISLVSRSVRDKENLLILDPGRNVMSMLDSYLQNLEQKYKIIGFFRLGSNTYRISGYKVYSANNANEFERLAKDHKIKAVLFPDLLTIRRTKYKWLSSYCESNGIQMLVLPSINEIKEGKINYRSLPEVKIEDLLERDEIEINMTEIAASLRNKVVMVTGAAGSIGSELCHQLCAFDLKRLVMYDSAETPMHNLQLELNELYPEMELNMVMGDVRSRVRFENICKSYRPNVIFHVAAYKHVPMMENNPCESVLTNVLGTQVVADTAVKLGVSKFIMVSTDKAVNPSNVMGASKRIAEMYVQSLGLAIQNGRQIGRTKFITTRFGNVLGSNGSVIPRFREQLAKGGPITVTHPEIIRYFMTIPEACRLLLEASVMGKGNEIYVFDMGEPVKIVDLARRMIKLAGMIPEYDIKIEYTGLRPGEKLYEELLTQDENLMPTFNKKIYRAHIEEQDYNTILKQIVSLCYQAENLDIIETVREMKNIVPEFRSKSSVYENLDGERTFTPNNYVKPAFLNGTRMFGGE